MTILEKLNQELIRAMKEKDSNTIDAIKSAKAKITEKSVEGDKRVEIDDNLCICAIENYIKQLKKTLEDFKGREDYAKALINKYNFEIQFLSKFLPQKLLKEEVQEIVCFAIKECNAFSSQHIGKVMGFLMKQYKDKLDPMLAKQIVEEKLLKQ